MTGGANGIGAAIVRAFWRQGAHVWVLDRDYPAIEMNQGITFLKCDLTRPKEVRACFEAVGPLDVLVNNAATDDRHDFLNVTSEYWDDCIKANLSHYFIAAQCAALTMIASGHGSIINVGSISWASPADRMIGYVAAKAGVIGLTRGLARELGSYGIRVNTISPGWVVTERQKRLWLTEEAQVKHLEQQCLSRMVEPNDIASVVLFIASDSAGMMTGQEVVVDGGFVFG